MPTPSDQPAPSAAAENDLHRPSGEPAPIRLRPKNRSRDAMRVTPPASASEHSPWRRAWQARGSETSEELHGVWMLLAVPTRPNAEATRPEATLEELPRPT